MNAAERKRKQRQALRESGLVPKEVWIHPSDESKLRQLEKESQDKAKKIKI